MAIYGQYRTGYRLLFTGKYLVSYSSNNHVIHDDLSSDPSEQIYEQPPAGALAGKKRGKPAFQSLIRSPLRTDSSQANAILRLFTASCVAS